MRLSVLLIASCALGSSTAALAFQFPTPEDPRARALLERAQMDTAKLQALLNFAKPAAQDWPCEAPLAYLYQPAGVVAALPEDQQPEEIRNLLAEQKRTQRKMLRSQGLDPNSALAMSYSNIELIPVRAQCVDGKLDGPVEYYLSYESKMESNHEQFSPLTNKVEKNKTVMNDKAQVLIATTFAAGKPAAGVINRTIRRGAIVNRMYFENAAVQKNHEDTMAKAGGLGRPMPTASLTIGGPDGVVTFSLLEQPQVTGGLFGVNTTWTTKLNTSVILIGGNSQTSYSYSEAQPLSVMRMNKETGTTESVTYVDNYLKKMGKKPGDIPGTEGQRELVLNGQDMLEMRMCMIDNKPVKIDPCPIE